MPRIPRPSPALIVASVALIVALGGTAYAATTISGRNITDHTIGGRKLIDNTLGGRQIKESALGTVPRAGNANTVGGFTVRKIFYAPTTNSTTPKTILQLGGLVLKATCAGGGVEIAVTSTADHANLSSQVWDSAMNGNADGLHHSDFGPHSAQKFQTLGNGNGWGETTFTYTRSNGTIVNGQLSFDSTNLHGTFDPGEDDIFNHTAKCLVSGFATSTASR